MGWSGPVHKRHRAAHLRVGHAGGGGTSLPGWLESACAFVRSARLRDGFVRFFGRDGPCLWDRRPGRGARDHAARRGQRHGAMPYASIADDSEVVRNRPIKCCDGFHSISHYPPAPAIRGEEAWRDGLAIREILTGGATRTFARTMERQVKKRSRRSDPRGSRYIRLRRLEPDDVRTAASRTALIMSRRQAAERANGNRSEREWCRRCPDAFSRESRCSRKTGEMQRGGKLPARRSGVWPRLRKPEGIRRSGRR
ncbi:hypothetical protein BLA18112_04449 [Burkholderia lata]|uniref:Uncharacterized protein n=1 Tax=Burkholderia lata (strain ATCC 17760 / DSM 23089 / LMG 22485 / NCIMB 9086 / R18194 / 383) TaxID=482957 RepID=A0A6P2XGJ3_BURL3|nr:hypothetical protein BLA18112_04449 [Burkholderia lata]